MNMTKLDQQEQEVFEMVLEYATKDIIFSTTSAALRHIHAKGHNKDFNDVGLEDVLHDIFTKRKVTDNDNHVSADEIVRTAVDQHFSACKGATLLKKIVTDVNNKKYGGIGSKYIPLPERIAITMENTARVVAKSRRKKAITQNVDIFGDNTPTVLELTKEEERLINIDKDELGIEEVGKIVGEKVIQTINNEKEYATKRDEDAEKISSATEHTTLFNHIQLKSYSAAMESATTIYAEPYQNKHRNEEDSNIDFEEILTSSIIYMASMESTYTLGLWKPDKREIYELMS